MISIRFTSKVLLVTVIPVITTALILASILISGRIDEFNKRINEKGNNIAHYLSPISEYGVFSNNFSYLNSTLKQTLKQPDIVAIYIEDNRKKIILKEISDNWKNADISNIDQSNNKIFSSPIIKSSIGINDLEIESDKNSDINANIGVIKIIMNLNNANRDKSSIIKNGIFITLISTLATILIALLFARSVIKPITTINTGVGIIKKGGLNHRISIGFSGELAELAQGINNMASSLEMSKIKDKQRAEDELFIEKTKAQITLEAIGEGVITTDTNGKVTYINPAAEKLTGYPLEKARNKYLSKIFRVKNDKDKTLSSYHIMDSIKSPHKINNESGCILICDDGTEYAIEETVTPLLDKEDNLIGAVLVFHDLTHIKKMSDVFAHQATHDVLTDLLNRRAFEDKMTDILKSIKHGEIHTLCYIDLDQFKTINDTCGHIAGDHLLKVISSKVNEHIRKNDLFARLGGDEFGIIFFNCDIKKAMALAENIKAVISKIKFTWDGHILTIGSSIGIVPISHGDTLTNLMMTVDTACYVAKDKGRNRVHVYKHNDEDVLQREGDLQWFQTINKALEDDSFVLYSQKISPYSNNKNYDIHEILIRLNKEGKIISPGVFIPAAERYSLMTNIDMWVVRTLFNEIKNNKTFENDTHFSINLSGQTLTNAAFIDFLNKELNNSQISPDKLIFEITETAAISNFNDATNFIKIFKKRGCKFALDDFGSGMSSFQYLSELPLDYIKIDGSFVKNIQGNSFNQSVIKSISQIGHSLGLEIIAEFVENDEILNELDKSLIDYVQGYEIELPHPLVDGQNVSANRS